MEERNPPSLGLGCTFHILSCLVISASRVQSRCLPVGRASEELVQRPKANMRRGSSIVQQHEPEDLRHLSPQGPQSASCYLVYVFPQDRPRTSKVCPKTRDREVFMA